MNIGLLMPEEIINEAIEYAETKSIPLNSLEGFVRQILGWREFIKVVYELKSDDKRKQIFFLMRENSNPLGMMVQLVSSH